MFEEVISRIVVVLPFFIVLSFTIYKIADWIGNQIIKGDDDEERI